MKNKVFIVLLISFLLIPITCLAEPPAKPPGSAPNSNTNISYNGKTVINSDKIFENKTFTSSSNSEIALLITDGKSTINSCTITKKGSEGSETSDFYGTNAAVLVKKGTLNINDSTVITTGSYANAVFSYDKGIININNSNIETNLNNSGGVMVTGGGILNATNVKVKTTGNSSAAIRSDRGGGELNVKKGSYETTGKGSPTIYSTAAITVEESNLKSTSSEGIVIEGNNSVKLKNTKIEDTNETLNGNSETYKNIFLYQSMSGDANEGESIFTSENSEIITNKGDTFYITNTKANISLINNKFTNKDGDFLRIEKSKWGNQGSNGGDVTLDTNNQDINGNILVDSISSLTFNLKEKSFFKGSINNENKASKLELTLSKDSIVILTKDSYLSKLNNEDSSNQNIYLNGNKLYVDGKEVQGNKGKYKEIKKQEKKEEKKSISSKHLIALLGVIALIIIILSVLITVIRRNRRR